MLRQQGGNIRPKLYTDSSSPLLTLPSDGSGDIIGCGLISSRQELFFTRNGKFLGIAFKRVQGKCFPTVALHSPGESLLLNVGQSPFKFDLESFVADERDKVNIQVRKQEVNVLRMNDIVHAYLVHGGYAGTAQAFASSLRSAPLSQEQDKSLSIRNSTACLWMLRVSLTHHVQRCGNSLARETAATP